MKIYSKFSLFVARKDKLYLIKNYIIEILSYFNKKKFNNQLESSNFSDKFYKKYLRKFYNQPKRIKNIFYSENIFFFSKSNNEKKIIIDLISDLYPSFEEDLLKKANNILNNSFNVFEKKYQFNKEIKWNYTFFNNKYWPFKHSSKINIHTLKETADLKYSWEFNKHSFLVTLGLAFYFTGDEKYSEKIVELIFDWKIKNPPRYNICWLNALEISMMQISWVFSLYLIKGSSKISDYQFYEIFKSMFQQAFFIHVNIEKFSYNHTIGEYFSLFLFSNIFKKIKVIKKWYLKSLKNLKKQLERQTLLDGTNIERSLNYHRFVLEFFTLFLIIAPQQLNENQKILINRMYTFLMFCIKPDKSIVLIGDFDDGQVIPSSFYLSDKGNFYYNELLSLGCILFNRGDLKYFQKIISPMAILLLGKKGYNKFEEVKKVAPKKLYQYFPEGGYFIARSSYNKNANFIFFDIAEFSPYGAHDHFDISNLVYSSNGKPILIDSGTYRYNIDQRMRNMFKDIKGHNVLNIPKYKNLNSLKTFGWNKIPKIEKKCIEVQKWYEFIVKHNCFKHFLVSRRILASKSLKNIKILDKIVPTKITKKKIKLNLFFHFPANSLLEINRNEMVINKTIKITLSVNQNINFDIIKENYYYSPNYGIKIIVPMINIEFIHFFENKTSLLIETTIK